MDTTTLQVPLTKTLKLEATKVARDYGFSSLQDVVRFILTKFAKREIGITLEQFPAVKLSTKNEKRYIEMGKDFKNNRNVFTVNSVEELMKDLRGN